MKQFDLETYNRLVAEGKTPKIVTRDRKSVRIVCTDKKGKWPIVALGTSAKEDCETTILCYADGKFDKMQPDNSDLFFADLEPTYRPYANAKEFLAAQKEHGMYVAIYDQHILPIFVDDKYVKVPTMYGSVLRNYNDMLDNYRWQDGSPCGVKEE